MPFVDKSMLNSKQNQGASYLDELAFAVCVNGDSLEKYKKIVEKQFGIDTYDNMDLFTKDLQQQVERQQFTNTSFLSLKCLGKNAGMSEETVEMIINHFKRKNHEEQQQREDNEYWNNCDHNDKHALLEYVRKYPKGRYVKEANAKINAINIEEKVKREETSYWNQCNPNDKNSIQSYFRKYPNGMYAIRAKSLIANLDKIENDAIEESRMYNQCRTRTDYMDYLRKYPNGLHFKDANTKIKELDSRSKRENEEQEKAQQQKSNAERLKSEEEKSRIQEEEKCRYKEAEKNKRMGFGKKWLMLLIVLTSLLSLACIITLMPETLGCAMILYGLFLQIRTEEKNSKAMKWLYIGGFVFTLIGLTDGGWYIGIIYLIVAAITSYIYRK